MKKGYIVVNKKRVDKNDVCGYGIYANKRPFLLVKNKEVKLRDKKQLNYILKVVYNRKGGL